jgi:hypothetical protein
MSASDSVAMCLALICGWSVVLVIIYCVIGSAFGFYGAEKTPQNWMTEQIVTDLLLYDIPEAIQAKEYGKAIHLYRHINSCYNLGDIFSDEIEALEGLMDDRKDNP